MAPRRPALAKSLIAAALYCLSAAAVAGEQCDSAAKPLADTAPLQQRLAASPLAFVGTLRSVDAGRLRFSVELALRGSPDHEFESNTLPGACGHPFRAGERWLFAGVSRQQPTRRLGQASKPLAAQAWRLDDRQLGLSAWQHCDLAEQCLAVDNGCLLSAVHRDHWPAARDQAWRRGGDPRAMSCEPRVRDDTVLACIDHRCGAWQIAPPR